MPTPSGQISLSQVNTELGFASTAQISLNDAAVRTLAGVPSGAISMANLQGKSSGYSITVSGSSSEYNLRNAAIAAGWPGSVDTSVTVSISPGVSITSNSTGTAAFNVGSPWPAGSSLTVNNAGTIRGRGGNGGNGGSVSGTSFPQAAQSGFTGGAAFVTSRPVTLNNTGSLIGGGGGGGGGGATFQQSRAGTFSAGGGGGGGGAGVSSGGSGGPASSPYALTGFSGTGGTSTAAGSGGPGRPASNVSSGPGGSGGAGGSGGSSGTPGPAAINPSNYSPGQPGGGAGASVQGNSFITYQNTGTRVGPIS